MREHTAHALLCSHAADNLPTKTELIQSLNRLTRFRIFRIMTKYTKSIWSYHQIR